MALVVDKTVKYLDVPDANNFTIQCSKPMSQLTVDDVKSADFWVGFTSFAHNQMAEGNVESGLPQNDPNHCWCWATDPSCLYDGDWSTAHWSFPANYPTGIYMRNILVECANAHTQDVSLQNDASARIVMDIEAGEDTKLQDLFISGSSYVTCPYGNENRVTDYRYIKPAILMIVNDVLYVWIQAFAPRMSGFFCDSSNSQGYRSSQSYDDFAKMANHYLGLGWTRALESGDMYTDSGTTTSVNFNYTVTDVDFNGVTADLNVSLGAVNYKKRASLSITDNEDKEIEKWYTAFTGFKFKVDDVWYKPIVEGGIVTGYTDDMTVMSEWDEWDNITGHNVPITPPSPTPSGEDAEPETFGWGGNEVAGMVRYYLLSQSEMEELQTFMSDASWRMDYRNCIIGMYVVPNGGLFFDAIEPTTLKFRIGLNEAEGVIPQDQELDTGIDCLRISGVVNNESAVIELPRINGNFLDFEPYSKYMVYVPFCGVIPLPDYVAGKEIKITIFPDVPTCTCTAVVTSEGRKIATAKGAYGSQLPVTSDGDGLKAASVINSLGNIIMGAGEVALGIGTGMVPLAIAGGAQMLGSGLQADLQLGQAFGYSIGASGDTSFFGAGNRCEYYVAYSKWNNPDIDEGEEQTNIYGHTYGFVCNKRGLLKDFEGFTVCDNPHVYGFSCTSDEKDEIERLLREGIIIHMPEE